MQDDERARLLIDVQHSLKSPLLAAIRRADFALKEEQPSRDDLVFIRALCARMWSQLSTFRTFTRLASGEGIQPHLAPLTVREILKTLRSAVQDAEALDPSDKSHRFHIEEEVDQTAIVNVDPNLFEMALREVIDNAVKHSYREGRIEIRVDSDKQKRLVISVTNEGPPILPSESGLMFERGWRSSAAMHYSHEGSGIGLYLVKAVMEAQDGRVLIEPSGPMMTVRLELSTKRNTRA